MTISLAALKDYDAQVRDTDIIPESDFTTIIRGLFGEVGGIMATAKKLTRESSGFPGYRTDAIEEFGDALWYFAALCRRNGAPAYDIFRRVADVAQSASFGERTDFELGAAASEFLSEGVSEDKKHRFATAYIRSLVETGLSMDEVVSTNVKKVRGAFLRPIDSLLPTFDGKFEEEEKLPWDFEIVVTQRKSGKTYLRWNGVFIGDPLTDNNRDKDGYRFHDVFHFANAAVLHWSPVFRSLIKQKRKSDHVYDEEQDSGRAIVVEEGVAAWLFAQAKDLHLFEGQSRVSLGILKTIQGFVRGYEVEQCPAKLWESAILQGYEVFRRLKEEQGGVVVGSRSARTVTFRSLRV